MPIHAKRLTDTVARALPPPAAGYEIHWCPNTQGFGLRVTAAGARAWVAERRVDGKTVRRTLGKASGAAAISSEAARRLQVDVSSELQQGKDRLEERRERRKLDQMEALTFGAALREYVKTKRRAKDGLPLKARTRADYLAMLEPAGALKNGRPTQAGELCDLDAKPLHRITADDIRCLHRALAPRGERRQTYAMQVLRAVQRHYGAAIAGNPLSPATAGAERVSLAPSRGNPSPIPSARLGAWWKAASASTDEAHDLLRFQLLTGARPGEAAGLKVGQVDLEAGTACLVDTKNRTDHTIMLSRQALDIAKRRAKGKRASAPLFGGGDVRPTLAAINEAAGVVGVTPHKLRHTFASVAEELVSAYTLKRMLNHAFGDDVTGAHYIGKSAEQLRDGWQAVADFIESRR